MTEQQSALSDKWNRRYQMAQSAGDRAEVVSAGLHLLPKTGCALDLACGLGANALTMAAAGLQTQAWDTSSMGLGKLDQFAKDLDLAIKTVCRDVENCPPEPASFDVIVVSQFLYRPICNALVLALKPGGLLFYQTFRQDKLSASGPSNPKFLLEDGELLRLFSSLRVRYYREDSRCGNLNQGQRDLALFIGQKIGVDAA